MSEIDSLTRWYKMAVKRMARQESQEFLAETRAFLCQEETQKITRPILNQWDWNQISPQECIKELFKVLVEYQAQMAMQQALSNVQRGNWMVLLRSGDRVIGEASFSDCNVACRWADRRLIESESDATATITARLEKTVLELDRQGALWRLRQINKHPFMKITSSMTGGGLGWGHKAREHRTYFSRG
jgi:hypothetical protein